MHPVRSDSFSQSNSIGLHHEENQDSYLVDDQNLLFAIADGVGGYSGAKEASSIAIDLLARSATRISDENSLTQCVREIHDEILRRSTKLHFPNMGTTLAVTKILPREEKAIIGNVGDSPILLLRGSSLDSIYEDDSHRSRDPLSMFGIVQYLGLECDLNIHTRILSYMHGDVLLLCSDGITDNLLNSKGGKEKLTSFIKSGSAQSIVRSALEEGLKPDDMTALLVFL